MQPLARLPDTASCRGFGQGRLKLHGSMRSFPAVLLLPVPHLGWTGQERARTALNDSGHFSLLGQRPRKPGSIGSMLEPDLPGTGEVEGTIEGLAVSGYKEVTVDIEPGWREGVGKGPRLLALCAVAAFVVTGLSYVAGYALEWRRAQISRSLIGELKRLEVGRTTEAQIRKLSDRYGGKYSSEKPGSYEFLVRSPCIMIANPARTLPGLRLWGLVVSLEVEHGYLSHLYLELGVSRSDGFEMDSSVRLTGSSLLGPPERVPYYVSEAHITGPPGESLVVHLGPTATAEEREKGFGFNFSCLTALRECRHVCDIMPSAWRDLSPRGRMTYEDGRPLDDYRECDKGTP